MIELTPPAIQEVKRLQNSRRQPHSHLRIRLLPIDKGCAAYRYQLQLEGDPLPEDHQLRYQDIAILINPEDYPHLHHLRIDYAEDLMGGSFRFYNPQAQITCRCGQAFTPKT